jgi:DNA-binding NarL/FixJ family response regulator
MANTKKSAPVLSAKQQEVLASLTTTSAKIRYLAAEGFDRGDIARTLNVIYQHVRNVLITPIKGK